MKTIAFFNNKGGVGKTSLVYHLAWMFSELGKRVVAFDLDPQANLTSAFLDEAIIEKNWTENDGRSSILGVLTDVLDRLGDIRQPVLHKIEDNVFLMPGNLGLSAFEDRVARAWDDCLSTTSPNKADGFRVMSAFYRLMHLTAKESGSDIVLIDAGPSIGAMNRAVLVASDYVVIPLGADLFSLQGLKNLGPTLRDWRSGWNARLQNPPSNSSISPLPLGGMAPIGYVLLNPSVRDRTLAKAYRRWADRVPSAYVEHVLNGQTLLSNSETDPNCLAIVKHFKSLMPMAQDARKPMFLLSAKDGAIGGHAKAVQACYQQFETLAHKILGIVSLE